MVLVECSHESLTSTATAAGSATALFCPGHQSRLSLRLMMYLYSADALRIRGAGKAAESGQLSGPGTI